MRRAGKLRGFAEENPKREQTNASRRQLPALARAGSARVITLNDDAALVEYGKDIVNELRANMVRVDSDFSATPFKAKISNAV